jgi:hypothetical protein
LWLFARLAFAILDDWAAPYAVGLFAIGSPFVYFSSHLKQYSSDILCALLITSTAVWMRQQPERLHRAAVLGAVGACVVWFSQPAVIVAAGTGLALAVSALLKGGPRALRPVALVAAFWIPSVAAAVLLAMRNVTPADRTYFEWFWQLGFWPWPPQTFTDVAWPFRQLAVAFGTFFTGPRRTNGGLNYPWSFVFAAVVLIGYVALWKSRRDAALLLLMPAVAALLASAVKLYPFTGRVLVFLLPSLLLALAAGARLLLHAWPRRLQFATPIVLALLGGAPIYAAATALPPERIEHFRPLLAEVAARFRPGDRIFVYHGAGQAFLYYARRHGFTADDYVMSRCVFGDPRQYLRQLDRLRGTPRVWIVATHLYYPRGGFEWMAEYLGTIGTRRESIVIEATTGASLHHAYAYQYDLSDPDRLRQASADTFALPETLGPSNITLACHGVETPVKYPGSP